MLHRYRLSLPSSCDRVAADASARLCANPIIYRVLKVP
jgi:hypothetical protein